MATYIKEQADSDGNCCEDCSRPGPCDGCTCPTTTLLCATSEASRTRCGFFKFDDMGGFQIFSKWIYCTSAGGLGIRRTSIIDRDTCSAGDEDVCDLLCYPGVITTAGVSYNKYVRNVRIELSNEDGTCYFLQAYTETVEVVVDTETAPNCFKVQRVFAGVNQSISGGSSCSTTMDPDTGEWIGGPCSQPECDMEPVGPQDPGSYAYFNPVTPQSDEYEDEYTLDALIVTLLAAVGTPGAPTTCEGDSIASFSLSSDSLTASGKAGAYAFPIPEGTSGCYKITWDRVSTPSTGSPTVTPMEYIWDGSATQSPTYNEAVPGDASSTPGESVEITIENIVTVCTGCI